MAVILLGLSASAVEALRFVRDCPQCNELAHIIGQIKDFKESKLAACQISILHEQIAENISASQKEREDARKLAECADRLRNYAMYRDSIEGTEDFFDNFDSQKQTQKEYFDQYVEQKIKNGNCRSADALLFELRSSIVVRMNHVASSTKEADQAALWKAFVNKAFVKGEEPEKLSPAQQQHEAMKTLNTLLSKQ